MTQLGLASFTSTRRSKGTHRGGATSVAAFLDLQIWIGGYMRNKINNRRLLGAALLAAISGQASAAKGLDVTELFDQFWSCLLYTSRCV